MELGGDYQYDVALSFAGEDRTYAEKVASELLRIGIRVFYDQNEQSVLWGKDLQPAFEAIYRVLARYCIVFVSRHYLKKKWTILELESAVKRARLNENHEYILPIRLDDTTIPEIPDTVGYLDGTMSAADVATTFHKKLYQQSQVEGLTSGGTRTTTRKRVFVCFDYPEDIRLMHFFVGQSRLPDSPFEVVDWSMKDATPPDTWHVVAERRIRSTDRVIVMVGPKTHEAPGVLREVDMAHRNSIPIVQVIGYKDGNYPAVPNAGRLLRWNWENLKKLFQ